MMTGRQQYATNRAHRQKKPRPYQQGMPGLDIKVMAVPIAASHKFCHGFWLFKMLMKHEMKRAS